jgi:hypothetical protein
MLRSLVILFGIACVAGAVATAMLGDYPGAWMAGIGGAILLLGTLWERVRYKPLERSQPGPGWIATTERFIDEETGKPVRVWLEPATGERRYVAE